MAIGTEIKYAGLDDLYLDPMNPRLGRNTAGRNVTQDQVLDLLQDWALEELAISYLDSGGYWPQEAMLVIKEKLYGKTRLVVVEGNRRLAALICLRDAAGGNKTDRKWKDIASSKRAPGKLFTKIPYLEVETRGDVEAFLGFRHVTGIKQWAPAEKAEYIANLIDNSGLSYNQVMRKIGSNTPTVRRNYISYKLLLQIEDTVEDVPLNKLEKRFSVMFLSLRTRGVQKYLHIDIEADPKSARKPVPAKHLLALKNFALWLFGTEDSVPLVSDSRLIDDFGKILENKKAVDYLERHESPKFDVALRTAGGDEAQVIREIDGAADKLEWALGRVHSLTKSSQVQRAVKRLGSDAIALLQFFPTIEEELYDTEE